MNQTQCQSGHGLFRGHIQQLNWWECDGKWELPILSPVSDTFSWCLLCQW